MFKDNKYTKIYYKIILRAMKENRSKNKEIYFEKHHIIPKCLGGTDDKENLILLTAREHFLCHLLLTKMNDDERLIFAFFMMKRGKNRITSPFFEKLKYKFAHHMSIIMSNRTVSETTKYKIKTYRTGKRHSQETKDKIKKNHKDVKGKNNPMFGLLHTDESRKKMSETHQGKDGTFTGMSHTEDVKKIIGEKSREKYMRNPTLITKLKMEKSKGTYITPWGSFISAEDAARHENSYVKCSKMLVKICKNNEEKGKIKSSKFYIKSPKELGFDFVGK